VVNGGMKKLIAIRGVTATTPRPTKAAAMFLATAVSIPVFVVLTLIEWVFL